MEDKDLPIFIVNIMGADGLVMQGARASAVVLPIDIENPYRLSNCLYRYISIYIGFLATNF